MECMEHGRMVQKVHRSEMEGLAEGVKMTGQDEAEVLLPRPCWVTCIWQRDVDRHER